MNWLDRAIASVAPEAALRRVRARAALTSIERLAYDGAKAGRRLDGWFRPGTSANAEAGAALKPLRDAGRDLVRNNPHARKALWEFKTKIAGTGIRPQAKTGEAKVDEILDSAFEQWIRQCNADGRPGYYGMQGLGIACMAESGEAILRKRPRFSGEGPEVTIPGKKAPVRIPLQIQLMEPDFLDHGKTEQTDTGYILQGVEFNKIGQRTGYWMFGSHPGDVLNTAFWRKSGYTSARVPASEIEHGYIVERIGQVRGITWFSAVIQSMHDLAGYQDAERVRKRVEACLAAFVTQPEGAALPLTPPTTNAAGQRVESFEPGMVAYLQQGSTVTMAEPKSAGGYGEYVRSEQHAIAAGLLLLYATLTGDLSQANYSNYRGGLLGLKTIIEVIQWEYAIPFIGEPVWRWFVETCRLAGIVPADTPFTVEWGPPAFDLLDREAEAKADKAMVRNGTMTLQQAIARQGYDPKKQLAEIAESNKLLDELEIVLDCDPRRVTNTGSEQSSLQGDNNGASPATN